MLPWVSGLAEKMLPASVDRIAHGTGRHETSILYEHRAILLPPSSDLILIAQQIGSPRACQHNLE
jgi:hypothetical protein